MKKLIFIGGTMGVGKSTLAQSLMTKLPSAVYLDGDWCWYTKPWILNEETRKIVILNVEDMLRRFIESKSYETIIFTATFFGTEHPYRQLAAHIWLPVGLYGPGKRL